ncbi:calcium/proton exchanger [Calycomorphotria hydatis]|uniref:Ca(2+)/H(+) antiporter n=1 Tax=Calycomorphotria hydatis TaxID=2528027 RepID=A0A517T5P4_9PLAN|nr:calcium/proton exchanger [Calycomorphotria hydatis]QDT63702.1 Putative cation exchanger YfkE [Calycomorphotria hydatis]
MTDTPAPKPFWKTIPKLALLLLFLPVVIVLEIMHADPVAVFICSGIAILGTVTLIGKATEEVAIYAGALWGGLLNATFGNVTELIIALFALAKGPEMHGVVMASITGSILGNLLLVLGGAMLYGGTKYTTQQFSRTGAHVNVGMLWVTLIMLTVPTIVMLLPELDPAFRDHSDWAAKFIQESSLAASIMLLILYGLMLLFSMRTHSFLLRPDVEHHETAEWSKGTAAAILLGATLCVAFLSEAFVGSIDHMRELGSIQMSELFIGVIIVAIVGNAAEGMVAVWVARENKMELSFQIAMGSSLQVALMVAPVLVIASYFIGGEPMALTFSLFEILSLAAAVLISSAALNDGKSNWIEGAMFLAVYIFFALVFWFHP